MASPKVSIVIKTLNEEAHIAATIESALDALFGLQGEVIVADSGSDDGTVEIAARYPVTIVRMRNVLDRGCGAGAQLGYQVSRGEFVYLLDGDMTLCRPFLAPALAALEADQRLAGVGGLVRHRNLRTREFRLREARRPAHLEAGPVDRLDGGGLFRRAAIEDVGYLADRNLHSFEELELGARLQSKGWTLKRLDLKAVDHHDHQVSDGRLMAMRWSMGYASGPGELLRAVWGKPHFLDAVVKVRLVAIVGFVYLTLAVMFGLGIAGGWPGVAAAGVIGIAPFVVMIVRKRDVALGLHSVMNWLLYAAAFPRGLLARRKNPLEPIAFVAVKSH